MRQQTLPTVRRAVCARLGGAATIAVITGLLGGCTFGSPSPTSTAAASPATVQEFGDHDDFLLEYQNAVGTLAATMPDDVSLPSQPRGTWEQDGRYEDGAGAMEAALAWQCAWTRKYALGKTGENRGSMDAALNRLDEWVDMPIVSPHIDQQSRQIWKNDVIGASRQGADEALLRISEGCV